MKIETIQPLNFLTFQQVKAAAFTLAETLIVIGIIGVVAALTLPNLNHATGDKEKVTRVNKIYSALTDAVDRAQVIYGDIDTWGNDLSTCAEQNERFAKRVMEFMKVSKDCGFGEGCFSQAPLMDPEDNSFCAKNYLNSFANNIYMVTLSDGMSVAFGSCEWSYNTRIRVDIDGPNKGKNQIGNDIFDFSISFGDSNVDDSYTGPKGILIPSAFPNRQTGYNIYPYAYATSWVIQNGNLDYLKMDDEGSCPDGQRLHWTNHTSCN